MKAFELNIDGVLCCPNCGEDLPLDYVETERRRNGDPTRYTRAISKFGDTWTFSILNSFENPENRRDHFGSCLYFRCKHCRSVHTFRVTARFGDGRPVLKWD